MTRWSLLVLSAVSLPLVVAQEKGTINLPLYRKETRSLSRRDSHTGAIGLGDYVDVSYSVLMKVGGGMSPVVLDTGSSDLWVISDACTDCGSTNLPLYPQSTFDSAGLTAEIDYGDSLTATHADGKIGTDSVSIAGLSSTKQYFAAITDTNTSVLQTDAIGIFGVGFPINSVIWNQVFAAQNPSLVQGSGGAGKRDIAERTPDYSNMFPRRFRDTNYKRPRFPKLDHFYSSSPDFASSPTSQGDITELMLQSFSTSGPLLARLAEASFLAEPMYSITLQRDTFEFGGNAGMISIGSLPSGMDESSFTWVPLRNYTAAEQGIPPPTNSPNEVYPLTWEVFIDDVYLDGKKLARSTIASSNIQLSSLVDTGNSLIRGPLDVVNNILNAIGADANGVYPCSTPHTLAFSIGGQMFPVDPRDFATQAYQDDTEHCMTNLAPTDAPVEGQGYLFSWSLGDPFLKGAATVFYFGNITYPSKDAAKMGFFSTVPQDADAQYTAALQAASKDSNLPATSELAPSGLPTGIATGTGGVPSVTSTPGGSSTGGSSTGGSSSSSKHSGASSISIPGSWPLIDLALVIAGLLCW